MMLPDRQVYAEMLLQDQLLHGEPEPPEILQVDTVAWDELRALTVTGRREIGYDARQYWADKLGL